jgi:hypothetical protein
MLVGGFCGLLIGLLVLVSAGWSADDIVHLGNALICLHVIEQGDTVHGTFTGH